MVGEESSARTVEWSRGEARRIAVTVAAEERRRTDGRGEWPAGTMRALGDAGLMGLVVPRSAGGLGLGYAALVAVCEELGRENPSASLAFGMHCVGTACITARATTYQVERYLRPIARGEHVTTLALSERESGAHFYLPRLALERDGSTLVLDGEKSFVTNAGHANSFVVSTAALDPSEDPGRFNLLIADADAPGVSVGDAWHGFGMRGNSARSIRFSRARVPAEGMLGEEGAQTWYAFEVVAPYFLTAMAGTYLGVASRAVDEAASHMRGRGIRPLGRTLADQPTLQRDLAHAWTRVEAARRFLYHAAALADAQDPGAVLALMGAKAMLDDVSVSVTNAAMTLGGGIAYHENSLLGMLLRDARASGVMSPTEGILLGWIGRSLLDLPMLSSE